MPAQSQGMSLKDRLKASDVREEVRYKEAEAPGGGSLPPGITGGIAKLTALDFKMVDKGDYAGNQRFYYHGTVVSPKTFNLDGVTHKIEGALAQSKVVYLCDTVDWDKNPVSFAQNYEEMENRIKLLGIPLADFEDDELEEKVLEYVENNDIYFKFRTYKNQGGGTTTIIEGAVDYEMDENAEDAVSEPEESLPPRGKDKAESKKKTTTTTKKSTTKKEDPPAAEEEEEVDWKELGKQADKGDKPAQLKISDWGTANGVDTDSAATWSAAVDSVLEKLEGGKKKGSTKTPAKEEDTSAEFTPEKDNIYAYTPDGSDDPIEVTCTTVFKSAQKCNVKSVEEGTVYKSVPWSALEEL